MLIQRIDYLIFVIPYKHIIRNLAKDVEIEFVDEEKAVWGIDGEKCPLNCNYYHVTLGDTMDFLIPNKNIDKLFK